MGPAEMRVSLFLALLHVGAAWDYSSNGGNWNGFGQCGNGDNPQSPIDLPAVADVDDEATLFLKYPKLGTSFQLYHNGVSIAFTLPENYKGGFGLGAELDGLGSKDASAYRLWQVNFHAPSEHTFQGKRMPLEMQLMHQRVTGGGPETAVVVVLFQAAANSYVDFLDSLILPGLPQQPWEEKTISRPIELAKMVGGSPFYHYGGSLTSPPCESGVKYYVRQEPINTAMSQLRQFQKILKKTCGPQGNFRFTRPLKGQLTLMSAVDVVSAPDVTVKPKISKVETGADTPMTADSTNALFLHCSPGFFDKEYKNVHRIAVGDSPEYIKAKERFNRNKRELQVAEGSEGNAYRAYKMQQTLYDSSPGWAEKINNKWALDGAKAVLSGATANLANYNGHAQEEVAHITEAILKECEIQHLANVAAAEKAAKEGKPPPVVEEPAPEPVIKPHKYSEPHVNLPTGVAASPFSNAESEAATDTNTDDGANLAKIAPNLHQPDIPPASKVKQATPKDAAAKKVPDVEDIKMILDLPINQGIQVETKDEFKSSLIKALSDSVGISPDRLEVKELKTKAVAKVHATTATLAQLASSDSQPRTGFLRSARYH